ncbi:MAG TPA: DUF29 domain-containing protein [Candidatus Binataceae bacterium]|nr:DUF29 domain-containing protein [Candidatus Binataceae bacterium]
MAEAKQITTGGVTLVGGDHYRWLLDQTRTLHARQGNVLDWDALAEELEAMAAAEKRELKRRLRNLLFHLLKWHYQPEHKTNSWRRSINNARDAIDDLLKDSPSLVAELSLSLAEMYLRARRDAAAITGLAEQTFPDVCPWTSEAVRDPEFWPDPEPPQNS